MLKEIPSLVITTFERLYLPFSQITALPVIVCLPISELLLINSTFVISVYVTFVFANEIVIAFLVSSLSLEARLSVL